MKLNSLRRAGNGRFAVEWVISSIAVVGLLIVLVFAVPRRVQYTETVDINAPVSKVYDHIRLQERLMRWSSWPPETGSSCAVAGTDGAVGAQTIYFDKKGARFGYQEVASLESNKRVEFVLKSKGPEQMTKLAFHLRVLGADQTRVVLKFDNLISRPFNVLLRAFGIVRWTRQMHLKDLAGLKRYAEPPHQTYTGEQATELLAA